MIADCRLLRDLLVRRLAESSFSASAAWDGQSLLKALSTEVPELVLLDVATRNWQTLLRMALDLKTRPEVVVLGLDADCPDHVVACAEAGASGLHLRSESWDSLVALLSDDGAHRVRCSAEVSAILLQHVYSLCAHPHQIGNGSPLSEREDQVLGLISSGLSNQQIASRLQISIYTVKNHIHAVLEKLGASSRTEAAAIARTRRDASRYTA